MSWPTAAVIMTLLLCVTALLIAFLWTLRTTNHDIDRRLEYLERHAG
jgi:hypothetical protein